MKARKAMEALRLQGGFRLGTWLIEPGELRVSGGGETFVVPPEHMQVLLCLVESKGEFVERRTLRNRAYAGRRPEAASSHHGMAHTLWRHGAASEAHRCRWPGRVLPDRPFRTNAADANSGAPGSGRLAHDE
jgi:hypothetical protein